jgi:hypothetical protein
MSLLTPSGGLVYHLRAARHRVGLWAPFRAALAAWLERWLSPTPRELILVGPSAGHCLPLPWLRGFQHLTILEPDPLARVLLARRLGHSQLEQLRKDLLLGPLLAGTAGLEQLLAERRSAAVLFCNVLGQLHFALSDTEQQRFQEQFRERLQPALASRPWASFHDRWSLDWPAASPTRGPLAFERFPDDQELASAWFGDEGPTVTALDHHTSSLFPAELPRLYLPWQLTRTALHLVEAVAGPR